jgi:photosystem I P700 chlorophyll a apoprotein A2
LSIIFQRVTLLDTRILGFTIHSDRFISLHQSNGRSATNRYFQVIGNIHDIESYFPIDNRLSLNVQIFLCHWGHLAIIFMWVSGNLFHIGWNGNYELWILNPIATMPIAHGIWDPHFASALGGESGTVVLFSGIFNWLYALGFTNLFQLYNFVILCELLAVISLLLGKLHLISYEEFWFWLTLNRALTIDIKVHPPLKILTSGILAYFDLSGLRLNFHIGVMIGFFSIAWCGHLVHCAIPVSRGAMPSLKALYSSAQALDVDNHVFGSTLGAGQAILTFLGGLKSDTASLYLTDIAHHHLAVGVLFVWAGHLYSSFYKGFGHRIRDVLVSPYANGPMIRSLGKSVQLQLSLALAGSSLITSVLAQEMYSLTPYPYLSYDYVTTLALYLHHSWIASFLMMAAFVHAGIFLIRDYTLSGQDPIGRICSHKAAIISHLSWVCLWLGFHTLGVYLHNDTVSAFSEPEKQILIEPLFVWFGNAATSELMPLGPGDLLAHHAIALGLHLTTLIFLKGSLDGRGSKLMPDKIHFGYGFACDGPGRGGTCDISAWDSFYLATFWMLNTNAWLMFYFHWKHLTLWQNTVSQFDESSTSLNGWFRDYLWFNSAPLIRGYDALGANDLSVWAWAFLGAHLCWATGFMFLISWRGYWQELIDIILYMHLKTPILYDLWNGGIYTPLALSIVQARFLGLVHFSVGFILTYAAFVIGATS